MATEKKAAAKPKKPREPKAPGGAKPDVKIERFQQNMRCELTDEEILERSRRQSRLLSEKALRVEAAKSATAHLKAEIKQIDSEISRITQEVNDGACFRDVPCERHFIYRTGKVVELRTDTGAHTYERAMTGSERQLELPKGKGEKLSQKTLDALEDAAKTAASKNDYEQAPDVPGSDEPPESGPSDDEDDSDDEESAAE